MDRSLLSYNLPATASKSSWIFAWLLPPAMAMSGLPAAGVEPARPCGHWILSWTLNVS